MSTPAEPVQPATPQTPAPPAPAAPPTPQPPAPSADEPWNDPAKARAEIERLSKEAETARGEAAKTRVNAKEQAAKEAREALLKQLSGDAEQTLTPEQLQEQHASATQAAAAAQIELSVFRTAQRLGANADALLDSRAFCDGIDALDIDPSDTAAFTAAVTEKVNAALAANPALRAGPTAGRSGGDMGGGGGSGDGAATIDAQIEDATKRRDFMAVIRLTRQKAAQQTTT